MAIGPLLVTLLFPHDWTDVPSVGDAMELSGRPKCLGSSFFGPTLSAMFGLCMAECFTNISAKVKKHLLPIAGWHIFLVSLQSSAPAHSDSVLSHTHPRLCHLRLCFHLVWLFSRPPSHSVHLYFSTIPCSFMHTQNPRTAIPHLVYGHVSKPQLSRDLQR